MADCDYNSAALFWGTMDSATHAYRREFSELSYQYFKIFQLLRVREFEIGWPDCQADETCIKLHSVSELIRDIADVLGKSEETARQRLDLLVAKGWVLQRPDPRKRTGKRVELSPLAREKLERVEASFQPMWQTLCHDFSQHYVEPIPNAVSHRIEGNWARRVSSRPFLPLYWRCVDALDICIRAHLPELKLPSIKILRILRLNDIKAEAAEGSRLTELRLHYSVTDLTKEAIRELRQTNVNIRTRFDELASKELLQRECDPEKKSRKQVRLTDEGRRRLAIMEVQFTELFHDIRELHHDQSESTEQPDTNEVRSICDVRSMAHHLPPPTFTTI